MGKNNKWFVLPAFLAIYIVWGSTYLAILIGLEGIPPFLLSSLRFLMAGAALYGYCHWKTKEAISVSSLRRNLQCGVLMLVGGVVSVTWAEQFLSSSMAAIIVAALPFWFVLLDKKQWAFYFSNRMLIPGLLLGCSGVILLLGHQRASTGIPLRGGMGMQLAGSLVIVLGGISWATGSLLSKYRPAKNSIIMNAALQFLSAGTVCLVISLAAGEWEKFDAARVPSQAWIALFYLVTMGSLLAYLSYLFLLRVRPPAQVSTYVYVNPVIALFLGAWLANESIRPFQVAALAIILTGVLLVNTVKYHAAGQKDKSEQL